jgi:hypothetical protein
VTTNNENAQPIQISTPDPALQWLGKLVGTWKLTGRTLGSQEDNISGRVTIEWLPVGFFMQQCGEIDIMGFKLQSLEIIGYDPSKQTFSSFVYSSMGGVPLP